MQWSDINRSSASRTLRQFAGLCLLVFGGLACWHMFGLGNDVTSAIFAVLAVILGPVGLVRPQALRWVYVGWMMVAFPHRLGRFPTDSRHPVLRTVHPSRHCVQAPWQRCTQTLPQRAAG